MISAFGMIGNGGVLVPHHTIVKILDGNDVQVWPAKDAKTTGERVVSRQSAYIITDILAGNTIESVNPFWAKWRITDGVTGSKTRPAAYKTGTTSDNRDVHAYGYLAAPSSKTEPALVAGVWMGNSDNSPNDGKLSLDTSAPLWSAILSDVSKGMKIEGFARTKPKGLVTATVDAFTGLKPSGATRKSVDGAVPAGDRPHQERDVRRGPWTSTPPAACCGRRAAWAPWRRGRSSTTARPRPASRPGRRPTPRGRRGRHAAPACAVDRRGPGRPTSTAPATASAGIPFGRSWGGSFAPTKKCPIGPPPPVGVRLHRSRLAVPVDPAGALTAAGNAGGTRRRKPGKTSPSPEAARTGRRAALEPDDRGAVAPLAALAGPEALDQRVGRGLGAHRVPQRARAEPVDDRSPAPGRPARRRRGSAPTLREPRPRGPRAGPATRPRCGLARAAGRRSRSRPRDGISPRARPGPPPNPVRRSPAAPRSRPRARGRPTATETRMPPASSVARLPPFSIAAIRPSQPPLRLRARSPRRQVWGTIGAMAGLLRLREAREGLVRPRESGIDRRGGHGLALQPAPYPGHVVARSPRAARPPRGSP